MILQHARSSPQEVYVSADASLPDNPNLAAVAAAVAYRGVHKIASIRHPAGQVTAPDVELYAIRVAVGQATLEEGVSRITIFTDSIASAQRAVNPSVHSGQGHSLAVCKSLSTWLGGDPHRVINFVKVPSKLGWGAHQEAHGYARGLTVAV